VTRITLDDDFTSDEGLWKALEAVRQGGQNVLVWVSIPCVGGSVLQYANAHHPGARRRMQRHYSLFLKLWRNACVVVEQALGQGGDAAIEWPTSCAYWRLRFVKNFLEKHGFGVAKFHGCAFGLMDLKGEGLCLKPWTVATTISSLSTALSWWRCTKDHEHVILAGKALTSHSANYPQIL